MTEHTHTHTLAAGLIMITVTFA